MNLPNLLNKKIKHFRQNLLFWHQHENQREMPWKGSRDVYRIWLSEIILQQTRVEQGRGYYERFLGKFPTLKDLAAASEQSVMKLWEGLGYYSRCRNLHHTAKYVVEHYNGVFPNSYEELLTLKGIGPYTAAAIASFGFNIPKAVVDGNVIRVMARYFGIDEAADTSAGKKKLSELAELCLDTLAPGPYNQAIMDFGATVCKPVGARCNVCRLKSKCEAYQEERVDQLPVISKKIVKKIRYFVVQILECKSYYAINLRAPGDIWAGLHSFPITEVSGRKEWLALVKKSDIKNAGAVSSPHPYHQQLTHQTIHAGVIRLQVKKRSDVAEKMQWVHRKDIAQLAFPRLLRDIIQKEKLISEV
jgi:A/G-specific adenine glycosylase